MRFFTLTSAALVAVSGASAISIPRSHLHHARHSAQKPDTYYEGYLEKYTAYHERYLAIDCDLKHNTTFFNDCCHPMLATETLEKNRASYCDPKNQVLSTVSSVAVPTATHVLTAGTVSSTVQSAQPTVTSSGDDGDDCEDEDPTSTVQSAQPTSTSSGNDDDEDCEDDEPTTTVHSAQPTSTSAADGNDDDCDDEDDDEDEPTTTAHSSAPTATSGADDGDDDCDDEDQSSTVPAPVATPAVAHPSPSSIALTPSAPVTSSVHSTIASSTPVTTSSVHSVAPSSTHVSTTEEASAAPSSAAKPTPSSSKAAPAPAPTGSSSDVFTNGDATFFFQGGQAGACGIVHSDNDFVAALQTERYGDLGATSKKCGMKIRLTNTKNGKSVEVTVADACPTCDNINDLDLSVAAFTAIATKAEGQVPIEWSFV